MENTCRVYKDREVLVFFFPLAPLSHVQPWGISPRDSPVDESPQSERVFFFLCVSFTVSVFSDSKFKTKHGMMKRDFTVKKRTSKMPVKVKLAIYMSSLKLEIWVTCTILSYFWASLLQRSATSDLNFPPLFLCSPPLRRRSMESYWAFGSDIASCCMTASAVTLFTPSTVHPPGLS